jgi:hypothetical protein
MKVLNKIYAFFYIFLFCLGACVTRPIGKFTMQDFVVIKPFNKTDTLIYASEKGQRDTIIFYPAEVDSVEVRSFELGYYDAYIMGVKYELTKGSYHSAKYITNCDTLYSTIPEQFYSVNISTKEYSGRQLSFLNLVFNEAYLSRSSLDTISIVTFKGDGSGNGRGVNSFKFSSQIGIISYTDTSGAEWMRAVSK